jgi:RNA polymerase sigma factor (sigma-70 family)
MEWCATRTTNEPLHRRPSLAPPFLSVLETHMPTIEAAQAGSRRAQQSLATTIRAIAYRTAFRVLKDEHEAKDLAHDSVIKVLDRLEQYKPGWKFSTWVTVITRNACIDWLRRQKRRSWSELPDVSCGRPDALALITSKECAGAVQDALQGLPPIYREVMELYHFKHMKYREISNHLGVPIGTVMNRIFRARQKMRLSLEDYWAFQPAA